MPRFTLLFGLLLVATATRVRAQQLRGTVRDSASRAPIPGAVVTLMNATGMTTARAITDAAGHYAATIGPSVANVRIVRIGFRPRDFALPSGAQRDAFDIAMERIPPMLDAVRVAGKEVCPGSSDRGSAFEVWDQVRAGLLATVVARDTKSAQVTMLTYDSRMSAHDDRIYAQTKHVKTATTTRPFVAGAEPSYFAKHGYMDQEPRGVRLFNAPDADVLIDDSFTETHCFHLRAADDGHKGQVGIAFTPAPGRDKIVDVQGVIWMPERTPELQAIDFLYTSLDRASMAMHTGGHIDFQTVGNGVAFVERWYLRLPTANEMLETGGAVLDAAWPDGTRWSQEPTVITGTVTQRGTHEPLRSGIVTLAGTPDTAVTSETGTFTMNVIPGKYTIVAEDTVLRTYATPRSKSGSVEVARGVTAVVRLEVAPTSDALEKVCRGQDAPAQSAVLLGAVSTTQGQLPKNVVVRASWLKDVLAAGSTVSSDYAEREVPLDGFNQFVVCGAVPGRSVNLSLFSKGQGKLADTSVTPSVGAVLQPVHWAVGPKR